MFRNIIPIILIGIAIAGFFMFTNPMYTEFVDIKSQMASYDEALSNSKMLENERDKLTKIFNSIDTVNLEKLQKLLPDSVDNIRLILEIEKLALPYGMILKDVKYATDVTKAKDNAQGGLQAKKSEKNYGAWDLEFSTEGTYLNFISFLKDLENNLRIVDVVSIDFSSDTGSGINPNSQEAYKYNLKIKTYWLKN
jgi:biopolymer transport protein ExbD